MLKFLIATFAFIVAIPSFAISPELVVRAKLEKEAIVGDNLLTLTVNDDKGQSIKDARVSLSVAMTDMDMGTTEPSVNNKGDGTYTATIHFSMSGGWAVTAKVEAPGFATVTKSFEFDAKSGATHADEMNMSGMMGRLGPWGMQKEGSGTSWLPESSPMFMKMLPKTGKYDLSAMGYITFNESNSGGKRSDSRFYSNSMLMLMARRDTGGGTLGLNLMLSLDPIFNGEFGYPDLFQTGETAYGKKLTDYQHPHDLLAELALSYSHAIAPNLRGFLYAAPVGEPALGAPVFMHRPSGMEIPEAPISHHWFDSTHIAWGVLTAGVNSDRWQLEASAFNGHEPDENRYSPDPITLNSASGRITYNPTKNLSLNASYGFLSSPESTEPGVDQHRITAVGILSLPMSNGDNLSMTAAFGRNIVQRHNSDSFLAEATYLKGPTSIFGRWEHVMKDELDGVPQGNYMINKFLIGGVQNIASHDGFDLGVGAYAGFYIFPNSLKPYYGNSPVTLGVFLRLRPSRMSHDMSGMEGH